MSYTIIIFKDFVLHKRESDIVIIRNNTIKIDNIDKEMVLNINDEKALYEDAIFFDLEHYVYKKPVCIGVFGCAYYDRELKAIVATQYMIESKADSNKIIKMADKYFKEQIKAGKKYIVTFSGNNDFTVLRYLYKKLGMEYKVEEELLSVDLQKEYEKQFKTGIGLKNLEKIFEIPRETPVISGSNLAKTIKKIITDEDYFTRMPEEKKEKILLYNEQDVVSLFEIMINWKKYITHNE